MGREGASRGRKEQDVRFALVRLGSRNQSMTVFPRNPNGWMGGRPTRRRTSFFLLPFSLSSGLFPPSLCLSLPLAVSFSRARAQFSSRRVGHSSGVSVKLTFLFRFLPTASAARLPSANRFILRAMGDNNDS